MINDFVKTSCLHFIQIILCNFQTLSMICILLFSNLRLCENNLGVSRTRTVLLRIMIPNMDAVGINTITICCFEIVFGFSCSPKTEEPQKHLRTA